MNLKSSALRLHLESALAGRVPAPFRSPAESGHWAGQEVETVPTGIAPIDAQTGGFPRGSLTEIFGPPGSGRMSLLVAALAARTAASEMCALVDGGDGFDPDSAAAAGVRLSQLLWVRCRTIDQALRSTDLLIHTGGLGLIAVDLCDLPPRLVRHVPLSVWFRFRRAVENTPTLLLLLEQESNAKACASLTLRVEAGAAQWSHAGESRGVGATSMHSAGLSAGHSPGCLLDGRQNRAEIIRSRMERRVTAMEGTGRMIRFETKFQAEIVREDLSILSGEPKPRGTRTSK